MIDTITEWASGLSYRKKFTLFAIVAIVLFVWLFSLYEDPTQISYGEEYELSTKEASVIKIVRSCPNVRSEPVADRFAKDETNSFGTTKEKGFTIEVSRLYTTDKHLDNNGSYYGVEVEDILATTEGKKWFPKGIEKDPDGIVWINAKYLEVIC